MENKQLATVHTMRTWDFAYRAARLGPWEQYGRDAKRFQKRIEDVEASIKHVFTAEHRARVYEERLRDPAN